MSTQDGLIAVCTDFEYLGFFSCIQNIMRTRVPMKNVGKGVDLSSA